jgi:hypothetical protein
MDSKNQFETKTTFYLIRLEYFCFLSFILYLLIQHIHQVRWLWFFVLFIVIDLIGYIPGAIKFRKSQTKRIGKIYYILYNLMHSFITAFLICLLWCYFIQPEWALLAIPLHLCGDRAIFGNFMKPFILSFEPLPLPEFSHFNKEINRKKSGADNE